MEENVRQELDALRGMVNNWKAGFVSWASPDGDNDHVLLEFTEEIQTNIYPYVRRLFQTSYLSEPEAKEFMIYCYGQVDELRRQLMEAESNLSEKEV
jgi:hypothetical protein